MSQAAEQTTRLPGIGQFRLRLKRNDLLLLLVALMEFGLGFETLLAHLISGSVKPGEAVPIVFGPAAGMVLLIALVMRWRGRSPIVTSLIIVATAAASAGVGIIGSAFHWARLIPPASTGSALRWDWVIYAPPVVGPLSFAGVGLLAIVAVLEDTRPETGRLTLPGLITFHTPLTQTRQFLWLVALGLYAATLSAFLDHGRTAYENVFVWTPVFLGLFAAVATTLMAVYGQHHESDYFFFFWTMLLMIALGVLGVGLHINADFPEGGGIQVERFIRGAPVMAPMLFALMGAFGLLTMLGAETVEYPADAVSS